MRDSRLLRREGLARELTRICCDMPIEATRESLRRRSPDAAGIEAFCDRQGFGTLLRRQAGRLTV